MLDPKKVHLVTYNRDTEEFEASNLDLWIRTDKSLFLDTTAKADMSWLILSAHDTAEEAQAEIARLEEDEA
jgi:hypothetical protein